MHLIQCKCQLILSCNLTERQFWIFEFLNENSRPSVWLSSPDLYSRDGIFCCMNLSSFNIKYVRFAHCFACRACRSTLLLCKVLKAASVGAPVSNRDRELVDSRSHCVDSVNNCLNKTCHRRRHRYYNGVWM